ncbi:MAG: hypothetical protein ACTHMI_08050 [Mucilaginibacter sp.]
MDQNYNSSQNDFLWTLLANPADDVFRYNYNLQRLVNDFPQSGILQALLAHSSEEKNLRQASVYFNPRSLYKLVNTPSSLTGVPNEKIIFQNGNGYNSYVHQDAPAQVAENYFSYGEPAEIGSIAEEQPEKTVYDTYRHDTDTGETSARDSFDENITIEQPLVEISVHEQLNDIPAGADDANTIEETPAIPESNVIGAQPETVAEPNEAPAAEIHEAPANESTPEPIINYAAGLGHRMPPDEENAEVPLAPPGHEEGLAEQHPGEHGTDPDISYAHSVEENTAETHLPSPAPVEALAEIHPGEADLPPTVYEPVDEQTAAEHTVDAPRDDDEPVQQYRPWNETQAEFRSAETEVNEDHLAHQPAEEFKSWEHAESDTVYAEPAPESHNIEEETFDEIGAIESFSIQNDILGNAVAADYFGFDRTFGEHKTPVPEKPAEAPAPEPANEHTDDQQDLSKYHDEKMPYSFLWWLDKTRKEHSGVYQPYAAPTKENVAEPLSKVKSGADELQQQYYENIFHITSVEELDKSVPPPPLAANPAFIEKKKEQIIIDRFIAEEPQIRPQSSDKLDNENKAKKSSEDRDELVSETLAAIYTDQMLYHKAIASYKKLMLRFPEKSRYFAGKIEQLEKKTN